MQHKMTGIFIKLKLKIFFFLSWQLSRKNDKMNDDVFVVSPTFRRCAVSVHSKNCVLLVFQTTIIVFKTILGAERNDYFYHVLK